MLTYRLRVELEDSAPLVWREVEVASDLMLDDLHHVVQAVMGWSDSHLHRFALGDSVWAADAELFLCPYDAEDGEAVGVAESGVRLDEVLVEEGDVLRYVYDYGDGWEHAVRLVSVRAREGSGRAAVCVAGERACPPEDCGGIGGYEELLEHGGTFDPDAFDLAEVNELLAVELHPSLRAGARSDKLGSLMTAVRAGRSWALLEPLVRAAGLDGDLRVPEEVAERAARRYRWLLDRVGDDGIKLTEAGYLPPVHVLAAWQELGLQGESIGVGNREDKTLPVLTLRESAQRLGLVRKARGRLSLTKAGRRAAQDPLALWRHVAARLPAGDQTSLPFQAGVLALVVLAAGEDPRGVKGRRVLGGALSDLGWRHHDGTAVGEWDAFRSAGSTLSVLGHLGALRPRAGTGDQDEVGRDGALLAGAALLADRA